MKFLSAFLLGLFLVPSTFAAEPALFRVNCQVSENGVVRTAALAYTKTELNRILTAGTSNLIDLGVSFAPYSASLKAVSNLGVPAFNFRITKTKKGVFGKMKEVDSYNHTFYLENNGTYVQTISENVFASANVAGVSFGSGSAMSCTISFGPPNPADKPRSTLK